MISEIELPLSHKANISIKFPYRPYGLQINFMTKVIQCIENGGNALLESPTGTGKTLCLLCSALGWQENYKKLNPGWPKKKIYFASRTHSQLSQVIKELKFSGYNPIISVLGSREQTCINDEVKYSATGTALSSICENTVRKKNCMYYENSIGSNLQKDGKNKIMDIEELVKFGKEEKKCPYFLSRCNTDTSDLIFLPYNYIIDTISRKSQKIYVRDSILIFDEGHNLEVTCGDASSFELTTEDLNRALREISHCIQFAKEKCFRKELIESFENLKNAVENFKLEILKINLKTTKTEFEALFIHQLFENIGVLPASFQELKLISNEIYKLLINEKLINYGNVGVKVLQEALNTVFKYPPISNHQECDKKNEIFSRSAASFWKAHRVHIISSTVLIKRQNSYTHQEVRTLSFWCFNSGVALTELMNEGARSIVVASGTLSPLESTALELGVTFDYRLENPHVINTSKQLFIGVLETSPAGVRLDSSFYNRENPAYLQQLGRSILNVSRISPGGLLVFFSSYEVMNNCIRNWEKLWVGNINSLWSSIDGVKKIFKEPVNKKDFGKVINDYYAAIKKGEGACFFAVCRGKASEGIDFSDSKARTVIICGVPYPASKDPKVLLKKKYLDKQKEINFKSLSGDEWYLQQASKAVNQAIGRVIRHRDDYGAILLFDASKQLLKLKTHDFVPLFLGFSSNIRHLPVWNRQSCKVYDKYNDIHSGISAFFKDKKEVVKVEENCESEPIPVQKKELKVNPAQNYTEGILQPISSIFSEKKLRKIEKKKNIAENKNHSNSKQQQINKSFVVKKKRVNVSKSVDTKLALLIQAKNVLSKADFEKLKDAFNVYSVKKQKDCLLNQVKDLLLNKENPTEYAALYEGSPSEINNNGLLKNKVNGTVQYKPSNSNLNQNTHSGETSVLQSNFEERTLNLNVDKNFEQLGTSKKIRTVRILSEKDLLAESGLPFLYEKGRKIKFKGKGYEVEDLAKLLNFYQMWMHNIDSGISFELATQKIERLCKKGSMKKYLNDIVIKERQRKSGIENKLTRNDNDDKIEANLEIIPEPSRPIQNQEIPTPEESPQQQNDTSDETVARIKANRAKALEKLAANKRLRENKEMFASDSDDDIPMF
ncbi:hypothetical protein HDU92_003076 [Lobulomyces angularis]|nr:hypothetical protein HDU92_003076 [Lobulomyces angularis]